jgi:hypothetical protein
MNPLFLSALSLLLSACFLGTYPDRDGKYDKQFPTTPLSNQVCQVNADCIVSEYTDGSCCSRPCDALPTVYNQDTYDRMRAHQKDICKSDDFSCTEPDCVESTATLFAACTEGHCALVKTPPAPTE